MKKQHFNMNEQDMKQYAELLKYGNLGTDVIDLKGSQGNAFYLLGYTRKQFKKYGFDKEVQDKVIEYMKSGDYDFLVKCFETLFSHKVIILK